MKSFSIKIRSLLAVLALMGFAGHAQAATISIVPGSQTIGIGGTANVDVVLSGLAQAIGGYNFDLTFSNAILNDISVTVNPGAKMGASPLNFSDANLTDGSPLHVELFADPFITEANLAALQGSSFILASLSFTGLTEGLSPLTLSATGGFLTNFSGSGGADGFGLINANVVNGSICVDDPQTPGNRCDLAAVPEPASLLLLSTGAAALLARRRRKAGTGNVQ